MADPIYGNTFAEDFAARRRILPQAFSASMPTSGGQALPSTMAQLAELERRYAELEGQQPDMSAMQEFARRQGEMGQNALLNAIAAQYAGEAFQPLQAKFLKQAEAAQQPIRMGAGILTPTGDFVKDPEVARQQQLTSLGRRIDTTRQMAEARQRHEETLDQRRREAESREAFQQGTLGLREAALAAKQTGGNVQPTRLQQADSFMLDNGRVVSGMFDPNRGYLYVDERGQQVPIPPTARPINRGAGGPLSAQQFNNLQLEIKDETAALNRVNNYISNFREAGVGWQRLADTISTNAKTFLGNESNRREVSMQVARGQVQGLLGMFRTDVVGPGVMTEQDAQRVLRAIGGDVTVLQNPQVVERLLKEVFESKRQRVETMRGQLMRSAPAYGVQEPFPSPIPQFGGAAGQQPAPSGGRRIRFDAQGNIIP
jgi:hypothetical protein